MKKVRKYTVYFPNTLSDKIENAYNILTDIDCNLSKLLQNLLDSIIKTVKYISKQKKNFRHYNWHLIIQDKETKQIYSTLKTENKKCKHQ